MRKRGVAILLAILLLSMGATGLDDPGTLSVNETNNATSEPDADVAVEERTALNSTADDTADNETAVNTTADDTTDNETAINTTADETADNETAINTTADDTAGNETAINTPADETEPEPLQQEPPIIMCAWAQDSTALLEDGDPDHMTAGIQFLPPCVYDGNKKIEYMAVVAFDSSAAEKPSVYLQLTLPDGTSGPNIMLNESPNTNLSVVTAASDAQLLTYGNDTNGVEFTLEDVANRLETSGAGIWKGTVELEYCQEAGDYTLTAGVADGNDTVTFGPVKTIAYLPAACCEYDFSVIDYGSVVLNEYAVVPGDADFGTAGRPTVRNTGNIPIRVSIQQDAMGFAQDETGVWPVEYRARLGSSGSEVAYSPNEVVILPDLLPVGASEEIAFSVRVSTGSGQSSGSLLLGCEAC